MSPRAVSTLVLAGAALASGGCVADSALDPAGEGAARIADLWWVMVVATAVPFLVVCAVLAAAVRARRRPGADGGRFGDRRLVLLGGVVLPLVVLAPIMAMTLWTARAIALDDSEALEVELTGHRFWWEVRYPAPGESRIGEDAVRSANEVHVPVGRPVELVLTSDDVIHSFWIPELHGKIDLIPGRETTLRIQADRSGVFRGQCAEFCGRGHAFMRLLVIAHPQEGFAAWLENEAAPARADPDQGVRQEFANSCAPCHEVRGLFESPTFQGQLGPDLTHLASRRMIGANLLPNTREGLGRWIVDPEGVKPGNPMPDVGLEGDELADIVAFLQELE